MPLRVLYGPSGSGKTYNIYKNMIDRAVAEPWQKFILIVPEQSSLQAQKKVVKMHPNHGVFNIDVLTFGRLGYRVFEELGVELRETIDDTGKNLIVRRVIENCKKSLKIVKASRRQGFISEMKSMISELKQYGITPEGLDAVINDTSNDRLKDKLSDINLIYKGFEDFIKDRFVTIEDKPEILYRQLDRSKIAENAIVIFDGFTGFTPVQYRLIEKIAASAKEIVFTATIADNESYNVINGKEELFYMSKDMIKRLGDIADRLGTSFVTVKQTVEKGNNRFCKSKELAFMEKNIFRFNRNQYVNDMEDVHITKLPAFSDEVQYVASSILKEIRQSGYRFKDVAVVLGDIEIYADEIERVFEESEIPYFMDNKRSLIGNPLIEYIRSVLEVATSDFSYESVFRFLKNGLCDIDRDNVDFFENYILEFGIRGEKRYSDKFVRAYNGKPISLEVVNDVRCALLGKISDLMNSVLRKDGLVKTYVRAIYDFIDKENVYEKLLLMAEEVLDQSKAEELRKSYNQVIELLDRIYELLGEEKVSLREFVELLDAGFEEIKVGLIPPSNDCVTIGDLERTRLDDIKVMFVLGANEGIIPKLSNNHGILSEEERNKLVEKSVVLSPSSRDKVFIQNFYLYLNLTKPSEKLYITYHCYGHDGKETGESRIIGMFRRMFPKLEIKDTTSITLKDLITSKSNAMHLLADQGKIVRNNEDLLAIAANIVSDEYYQTRINEIFEMINDIFMDSEISKKAAELIYEDYIESSISRIETFASCAFKHFAGYGLELKERRVYELNDLDIGTVFHKTLELIGFELEKNNKTYADLSDDERIAITSEMVERATIDFKDSYFNDSAVNAYMKNRLSDMVEKTLWALGEQLKAGDFKPFRFEQKFNNNFDGVTIVGKVDRIDTAEVNGDTYVKIVDYKSGEKKITREDLLAGTNIQLLVYMENILEEMKKVKAGNVFAAGALYNRIFNPIISDDGPDSMLKAYRPTGIVGHESVKLLDKNFEKESMVIPVKANKGVVPFNDTIVSDEQFKTMTSFATNKMIEIIGEIKSGIANANPYDGSCNNCPYSGMCGFNAINYQEYREKEKADKELFWQQIGWEVKESEVD